MKQLEHNSSLSFDNAISLINNVLYQFNDFRVYDTFGKTFYDLLITMKNLPFEADGIILDFFKNSTALSPKLIDDFIDGKLTERDFDKILEVILAAGPSAYFDPRYLAKLRRHGYIETTDQALNEFKDVITSIRKLDAAKRNKLFNDTIKIMDGEFTVEPKPVKRHYKNLQKVVNQLKGKCVIYISPEMKLIGGPRSIFAGGLGVLAGEYVEGLGDCGITTYGITLLYAKSIIQRISPYGISTTTEIPIDYTKLPVYDTGIIIEENIMGLPIRARVWEMEAGPARIFALQDLTSGITEMLYGGEKETHELREKQNQLLGRGGIKAIEQLYAKKIIDAKPGIVHLNEANCYCALDEIQRKNMFPDKLDKTELWIDVGLAFTTHTPVPAGLPMIYSQSFSTDNIIHLSWLLNMDPATLMRYYVQYPGNKSWNDLEQQDRDKLVYLLKSGQDDSFINKFKTITGNNIILNLTEGTAALSNGSTSVSLRHEQVTNEEIINFSKNSPSRHGGSDQATAGVTNGVNMHDWQPPEFQGVPLDSISAETILAVKRREKEEFIEMVNIRSGSKLSPEHLTVSVMRRINTYKRTDLIIREIDLLVEKLGDFEINIVFSGIPHGKDQPAQEIFKKILAAVNWRHPNVHVAFVCQYDVSIAKHGVRGSDIWLMQPVEKKEASSTSHQKALGAATLVASTYDGAMIENVVDVQINPKKATGAFLTPLIVHRILEKKNNNVHFVKGHLEFGNFYNHPVISINTGKHIMPVAVIDKGDKFVIVDKIVSDVSPYNLKNLNASPPDYLKTSPIRKSIKKCVQQDGSINEKGFHGLMYDVLDPFSTSDLHHLYDFNPQPWYNLLYTKIALLADIYYKGVKQGDPVSGAQWIAMMRNSLYRTYEVDIHRMAAEYIRDIYDHINSRKRKFLIEKFTNKNLLDIAFKW
ncbi:glycogen/starch/alpha-glucan phosphorylase, partial [bacterium]|nr:glycogen/starch/alpha-glucan phosphorylase [bacterium]